MFSLAKFRYFFVTLLVGWMAVAPLQAYAGYAALTPPTGWAVGNTFDRVAANAGNYVSGRTLTSAVIQVEGRALAMPVAFDLAANAASYVVAAARLTPGAIVTGAVATWLLGYGLQYASGLWTHSSAPTSWTISGGGYPSVTNSDVGAAAPVWAAGVVNQYCAGNASCIASTSAYGWYFVATGTHTPPPVTLSSTVHTQTMSVKVMFNSVGGYQGDAYGTWVGSVASPAVESDFTGAGSPAVATSIPDAVANAMPKGVPLPVAPPVLNPGVAAPGAIWIPTGSPVPVAGTSPQQYSQPGYNVTPKPTTASPWQVVLDPVPHVGTNPDGEADPAGVTTPPPTPPFEMPCGVTGKPGCGVKVDETGVPTTAEDPTPKIAPALAPANAVASNPDSIFPAFPSLNWNFALPTGCSVIPLAAFHPFIDSLDVCQFQPTFHDLMTVVWLVGGIFGAIQLFLRDALAS